VGYPQYLFGLLCATRTARAIGAQQFTAIEFGVAGGNGLIAMEQHAALVEEHFGIAVQVVGFDNSSGLPQRTDPRDCPFALQAGDFPMDEPKLRARLKRAELRLGDVADTVPSFMLDRFAPIGFVANDLDLYTSTRDSFKIFDVNHALLLPRVTLYFDDLLSYPYTTATGEWAAIHEFNSRSENVQIGQVYGLKHTLGSDYRLANWTDLIFVLHFFHHPAYNMPERVKYGSAALRSAGS
jgi:hypothetical protein